MSRPSVWWHILWNVSSVIWKDTQIIRHSAESFGGETGGTSRSPGATCDSSWAGRRYVTRSKVCKPYACFTRHFHPGLWQMFRCWGQDFNFASAWSHYPACRQKSTLRRILLTLCASCHRQKTNNFIIIYVCEFHNLSQTAYSRHKMREMRDDEIHQNT